MFFQLHNNELGTINVLIEGTPVNVPATSVVDSVSLLLYPCVAIWLLLMTRIIVICASPSKRCGKHTTNN